MWSRQLIIICTALSFVISAEGLIEVFGYKRRDVNITCHYDEGYQTYEKYLCKNNCDYSDVLITTTQKNKGKYSITDNIKIRVVTVTISDLQSRDAGKYWCGITVWGPDLYTEVKLHIKEDRCCNNVNKIQSIEEGSVTISCPYDSQSVDKLKFLCRGNRPSTCLQQAVITSSNTQNGRFRLSDDRKSTIFTVTISSLTLEDSGSYLCGVQRNSGFDDFSAVELEVKDSLHQTSSADQVTSQPPSHNPDVSLFYILPAVFALLLILTFVLLLVLKYKSRIKQVDGVNSNVLNSDDSNVEMRINDIYNLQEDAVYMNSSTPNMLNHDDNDIYNNIL
ncbi:CMRF35-like molecule 7 isoform X3 [Gambusia affinis]|uniref:CMRF35-like molecule 7 isoform X3 n=1 Tax=Gambusia affinis TaxID=33528 RepID=UPI001CDD6D74|nr:CMRF35-like molecule 7 isoform X3 [Gambusia affinis]